MPTDASRLLGLASGGTIIVALPLLTVLDRAWLLDQGWSPVTHNRLQWPSLLLLGPHGWAVAAALLSSAACGLAFAMTLRTRGCRRTGMWAGLMACNVALVSIPPVDDARGLKLVVIHNVAYVGVLATWALAAQAAMTETQLLPRARSIRLTSAIALTLVGLGAVLEWVPAIGQVARRLIIFPMAAWTAGVSILMRDGTREADHARTRT